MVHPFPWVWQVQLSPRSPHWFGHIQAGTKTEAVRRWTQQTGVRPHTARRVLRGVLLPAQTPSQPSLLRPAA